jgi:predicted nucleotidyltransferase
MTVNIQLPEGILSDLEHLLDIIISIPTVRSVILFGSAVNNTMNTHSDIDLLVIVDGEGIDQNAISLKIRQKAFGKVSFPFDLIIETRQDYLERSQLPTLERRIMREGKVLYAA